MTTTNLIRLAGIAMLLGAILDLATTIMAQVIGIYDLPPSHVAATTNAIVTWTLTLLVTLLVMLGLVGLYAKQAGQAGVFGLIAFVVALAGQLLSGGINWAETFLVPSLATQAPGIFDEPKPAGWLSLGFALALITPMLGLMLMGVSSVVSKTLPAWAGWGLVAALVISFVVGMVGLPPIVIGLVLDVGLGMIGFVLWSGLKTTLTGAVDLSG